MTDRVNGAFTFILSAVSSTWIFAIMALVCLDVAMRNLLNAPISGVAEFIALSVPACVFLQLPSAIAQRRLMRAELLIELLESTRPRAAAVLNGTFMLIGMLVFWKILVWAWPDFEKAYSSGEYAGAQGAYTIPVWPFKLTLIVGRGLGFLQFARQVVIEGMILFGPAKPGTRDDARSVLIVAAYLAGVVGFVTFLFVVDPRPLDVGIYCLAAMLALVLLGMPIALVLMSLSYIGIWIARSGEFMAVNTLGLAASSAVSSYEFGVIPLFIMMGLVLEKADVGRDAFAAAASLLRRVRGGLGIATVFANAIFASIVGSSIASAAVFSRIAVPQMVEHGYTKRFSVGCVAGSSVLGMLIPPSLLLIIYGLMAEESVGKLFIAAVIPGMILAMSFALAIYAMTWLTPRFIGDARAADDLAASSPREIFAQLGPIVVLVTLVIGGIYGGLFTPTEAAAVGAAFAFLIALAKQRINWTSFKEIVLESGYVSAAILFLIVAANLYTRQVALTGIPSKVANWVASAGLEMSGFLAVYFLLLLLLGMILDSVSIMLIMLPIMIPVLEVLGGDKIWFGAITVIVVEIGLLTPP
ncbi:MAG: TRAP transporter large permease subunit, partial [Pseudolabrys sp.]|nr:TRAP transporter large permease subunit [Pseudolabrys sp.]